MANPQANGKKSIGRRFSFDQQQVQPGSHVIYWANAADYLGGWCQFDVLDSSCSSSRAAELIPPKDLTAPAILFAGE